MAADGGDIRCLSPHETNEWHPSVTHRWSHRLDALDYVDRISRPRTCPGSPRVDGRDPRPIHGNYAWRGSRPRHGVESAGRAELAEIRGHRGAHHGQAFGSLVIVDPRQRDDTGARR